MDAYASLSCLGGDEMVEMLGGRGDIKRKNDFRYSLGFLPHGKRYTLDSFVVAPKLIGEGKFGKVYRAREKASRATIVLKCMEKNAILEENVQHQIRYEIEIHSRLKHPNIVAMYGYFMDADRLYLMMEHANGGSLYEKLQRAPGKKVTEDQAADVVFQVCKALEYLHRINVVHRDLKPENILISRDATTGKETIKIADFGWSVVMREDSRRFTLCGTVEYLPPEVAAEGEYGFGFDMWTVGVLAYEMLAGYSPFAGPAGSETCQDEIMSNIQHGYFAFPAGFSATASDFISKLLVGEMDRMSPSQALQHPWITAHCGAYKMQEEIKAITTPCVAPWKPVEAVVVEAKAIPAAADIENSAVTTAVASKSTPKAKKTKAFSGLSVSAITN